MAVFFCNFQQLFQRPIRDTLQGMTEYLYLELPWPVKPLLPLPVEDESDCLVDVKDYLEDVVKYVDI